MTTTTDTMPDSPTTPKPHIAIAGGGIIGLVLALGLLRRGIPIKIYEQSKGFREIGAGVAFTKNAVKCMGMVHPGIVEALRSVATDNGGGRVRGDYLRWVDGFNVNVNEQQQREEDGAAQEGGEEGEDQGEEKLLYKLHVGDKGFEGCHRAHLLDALVKSIPEGTVEFGKRVDSVEEIVGGKVRMRFVDGTSAEADALIGCDGIKSRVRELLFGASNPASYPHYTNRIAFRGLIPMPAAIAAIGEYKAKRQHMHIGPNQHMLHFPVAGQTLMNFVAFLPDPNDWPDDTKMVAPAKREEVVEAFKSWGPTCQAITRLLPDELDKWAIYDSYDHPAPFYAKDKICLAGDAAHAAAPHHGAGAGIGVEDALCLSTVLEDAMAVCQKGELGLDQAIKMAFQTFEQVRHERSQWLVQSSRRICDVYEFVDAETGTDVEKQFAEIKWRSHKIWFFDIEGMIKESKEGFANLVEEQRKKAAQLVGEDGRLDRALFWQRALSEIESVGA